jgi:hypothetical protein
MRTSSKNLWMSGIIFALLIGCAGIATADETESSTNLSKQEVKALASSKTAADHQRLAAYYHGRARALNVKAQDYAAQAEAPTGQPNLESKQGTSCNCPSHYRYFSRLYTQEAQEAEALAAQHEQEALRYQK